VVETKACRRLCYLLVRAYQSSTASVRWHHGSSAKHCFTVFQIL